MWFTSFILSRYKSYKYLGKIVNCFSNEDYTYLLNDKGNIFSFGNNNYGQLGYEIFF